MELTSENLELNVSLLNHGTPNQELSILNEDVALPTEKIIQEGDSIQIEKEEVITKKVTKKEKLLLRGLNVSRFSHQPPAATTNLLIDESVLSYSEVYNQDESAFNRMETSSQGSADSKMETSSQGSADSKMETSSQGSAGSKMDISSQGSSSQDSGIKPNIDSCVQNIGKVSKRKIIVGGNSTLDSEITKKLKNFKIPKVKKNVLKKKIDMCVSYGRNVKKRKS